MNQYSVSAQKAKSFKIMLLIILQKVNYKTMKINFESSFYLLFHEVMLFREIVYELTLLLGNQKHVYTCMFKPGFPLQQTSRPRHKKPNDHVTEQSSFPLIVLF